MLENLHNGPFGKSEVFWQLLGTHLRVVASDNSELICKYLCGYTLLFFTIFLLFLMYSLIFMNMQI